MKNVLLCISLLSMCNVNAMTSPFITYTTKDEKVVETKITSITVETFKTMSITSLEQIKQLFRCYQRHTETETPLSSDDDFTEDDAYFAINGVKMRLKEALKKDCPNKEELIRCSLSSLRRIMELNYSKIPGYKYCLAILCLHFQKNMSLEEKAIFFGALLGGKLNMDTYGLQLMTIAASPKSAGGDDDVDAGSYLDYYSKS